jgi:pilus assembly protein Flp/PilA
MKNLLLRLVREDDGQDLIEYALLAAFISLAAVAAITQLGTAINNIYTKISNTLDGAGGGGS